MFRKDTSKEAASIGIIGGADGPTAIFLADKMDKKVRVKVKNGKTRVTVGKGLFKKTYTLDSAPTYGEYLHEKNDCEELVPYIESGKCSAFEKLLSLNLDLDECMGLKLSLHEGTRLYEATPPNAIIFAQTGCDGDHFAFLPNNPKESLDNAKVIAISPMSGEGYGDAGLNFKEFLRLFVTVGDVYFLFDLIDAYSDRKRFHDILSQHLQESRKDSKVDACIEMIKAEFQIEPIVDLYRYFSNNSSIHGNPR